MQRLFNDRRRAWLGVRGRTLLALALITGGTVVTLAGCIVVPAPTPVYYAPAPVVVAPGPVVVHGRWGWRRW